MNAPLQMPPPEGESGDVLASIRRLISHENTPAGRAGDTAARDSAPLRLRPDALIPAETPPIDAAPAASPEDAGPLPPAGQKHAGPPTLQAAAPAVQDPLPPTAAQPTIRPDIPAPHGPAPHGPALHGPALHGPAAVSQLSENRIFDEGTNMLASHDTTVQPLHPGAVAAAEAPVAEPAHQLHVAQTPRPDPAPAADHPLRALLREAVRDELECEMRHRLDTELRQMIRAELSAALTEALARPAAA